MINISSQLSGIIAGKEKIPIARVEVYDTSYTVPSKGFYVSYFSGVSPTISGTIRRTQFESKIFKDWSNGLPVELSNYIGANVTSSGINVTDAYSIVYSGWYYAAKTGIYTFSTRSNAGVELFLNSVQVLSGSQLLSPTTTGYSTGIWAGKNYVWNGTQNLNPGWYELKLNMYWNTIGVTGVGYPFLTAFHQYNSERPKVLSAGAVNYLSGFLQPINIDNLIYVTEDVRETYIGSYSFEVPFDKNGKYQWNNGQQKFGNIKPNTLCSLYMGYATESGYYQTSGYTTNLSACTDFVQKFTGSIDSVTAVGSKDSRTLVVKCRDFGKKLLNAINENYPDRASYTPAIVNTIDPLNAQNVNVLMPNAYDNWIVFDAIEDMCLHAGIDPNYLDRSKWDIANYFKLESNLNWPYTSTYDLNGLETKLGDPYIFKLDYGITLLDGVNRFKDLLGLNFYFKENGNVLIKEPRYTQRVEIYESGNYGLGAVAYSGTWSYFADINTSNRLYIAPILTGSLSFTTGILTFGFSGIGFSTYQTNHSAGSGYHVDIRKRSDNSLAFSGDFTNYSSNIQYGSLVEYTRNLPLDQYVATISPSGQYRLEGFEYYSANIYKPQYSLTDNIDISNINFDMNDDSVRNEIICVGQQIGDLSYLYSKAIDLDSISNPDAFNYIGEKRTTTIVEPTIQSQRRLDWLAQNILQKYRRKQRNISIQAQGLPHLQVGDSVGINFDQLNLNSDSMSSSGYNINNEQVYYVRGISSNLTQSNYIATLTLTSLKPIESYKISPSITNEVLGIIYAQNNNSIFANFRQETLNTPVTTGYGYNPYSEQAAFVSFDSFLDLDRLWVLIGDKTDGGELFKDINIQSKNPLLTYTKITNPTGVTPEPQGGVWLHNGGGEKWGRITVPTAQNNFNGGQWIGQNSEGHTRIDGVYPIAIWAQFRTSDQNTWFQGLWVPPSGGIFSGNRALAWSPTSTDNKYYALSSPKDASNAGVISVNSISDVKQAYLPGFAVKGMPLELDIWIGPETSGYQIVSSNKLVDLSSKFTFFGNRYNQLNPIREFVKFDTAFYQTVFIPGQGAIQQLINPYWNLPLNDCNIETVTITGVNSSVNNYYYAEDGPWNVGDRMLFYGSMPSNSVIQSTHRGVFFPPKDGRYPAVSLSGDSAKAALGFANQGINITTYQGLTDKGLIINPTGVQGLQSRAIWNEQIGNGKYVETASHILNALTISSNIPIYLNYDCVDYGYNLNFGTTSDVYFFPVFSVSSVNYDQAFKRIAFQLTAQPGAFTEGAQALGAINRLSTLKDFDNREINYFKFGGGANYVFPLATQDLTYEDFAGPGYGGYWRKIRLHKFTITNSASGEKYYFIMRSPTYLGPNSLHAQRKLPYGSLRQL